MLGVAALAFGAAFGVGAVGHGLLIADLHSHGFDENAIAEGLFALEQLTLLLAAAFAAQGFLFSPESRRTAVRDAAAIAAAAYGFGLLGQVFLAHEAFANPASGAHRAAALLNLAFVVGLLAAAATVAVAFFRRGRSRRDRRLAWAGLALAAAGLLGLVGGALTVEAHLGTRDPAASVGFGLQSAGYAVVVAVGAIAAGAFYDASLRVGSPIVALARRDLLLSAAASVLFLFFLLNACGLAIIVVAAAGGGISASLTISGWVSALGSLVAAGAAVCLAAAFQPALRKGIRRFAEALAG